MTPSQQGTIHPTAIPSIDAYFLKHMSAIQCAICSLMGGDLVHAAGGGCLSQVLDHAEIIASKIRGR